MCPLTRFHISAGGTWCWYILTYKPLKFLFHFSPAVLTVGIDIVSRNNFQFSSGRELQLSLGIQVPCWRYEFSSVKLYVCQQFERRERSAANCVLDWVWLERKDFLVEGQRFSLRTEVPTWLVPRGVSDVLRSGRQTPELAALNFRQRMNTNTGPTRSNWNPIQISNSPGPFYMIGFPFPL
jgi:hypothetical protein